MYHFFTKNELKELEDNLLPKDKKIYADYEKSIDAHKATIHRMVNINNKNINQNVNPPPAEKDNKNNHPYKFYY